MVVSSFPRRVKLQAGLTACLVAALFFTNYHIQSQYSQSWETGGIVNQLSSEHNNDTDNLSKIMASESDLVTPVPTGTILIHNKTLESAEVSSGSGRTQLQLENNKSSGDTVTQMPTERHETSTIAEPTTSKQPHTKNKTSTEYSEPNKNTSSDDGIVPIPPNHNDTIEALSNSGPLEYWIPPVPDANITENIRYAVTVRTNISASPLENCSATDQVRVEVNATGWFLHSFANGKPKEFGGDDFFVTFTDYGDPNLYLKEIDPSAVAMTTYVGNGIYYLEFFQPPMRSDVMQVGLEPGNSYEPTGVGILTVYFAYTCSIGSWDFASKHKWLHGAASQAIHSVHNVTAPDPIRPFQFPPLLNVDNGGINFANYDNVVCFGDSVLRNFCGASGKECPPKFHKKNMIYFPNVSKRVTNATIPHFLHRLATHFQDVPRSQNGTNALIMSSSAWDLLLPFEERRYPDIDDHITALRELLGKIRQNYTNFSIFWKSPQALHIHVLEKSCYDNLKCIKRVRFMSDYYLKIVYNRQKALMEELDVPFMDVYELSYLSAARHNIGDGIHYSFDFNHAMLNLTYPKDYPETPLPECEDTNTTTTISTSASVQTNDTDAAEKVTEAAAESSNHTARRR